MAASTGSLQETQGACSQQLSAQTGCPSRVLVSGLLLFSTYAQRTEDEALQRTQCATVHCQVSSHPQGQFHDKVLWPPGSYAGSGKDTALCMCLPHTRHPRERSPRSETNRNDASPLGQRSTVPRADGPGTPHPTAPSPGMFQTNASHAEQVLSSQECPPTLAETDLLKPFGEPKSKTVHMTATTHEATDSLECGQVCLVHGRDRAWA